MEGEIWGKIEKLNKRMKVLKRTPKKYFAKYQTLAELRSYKTDSFGCHELVEKLKAEYLQERQEILLSGKAFQRQQQMLVKIGKTVTPKI